MRFWPFFDKDEIDAVQAVLRSGKVNYWTGEECRNFEREFASSVSTKHAVALANGTVALEAALHVLGIGAGDEVIVTSRSFVASAGCVVFLGARPIFADVDRDSQNITVETISAACTKRTRAIIAVHLAGWPCDMDPIIKYARENGLLVIEDCAQAQGALYKGKNVGSLGDMAAFSFCQDKIMTTAGEGGMVTTNDRTIWSKAWSLKDHGKDFELAHQLNDGKGFRWLHKSFGTNWRMTEMQAAIGRIQLRKLPVWLDIRGRNAGILTECFRDIPAIRVTIPPADVKHAYYKYYAFVRPQALKSGWDRNRIIKEIVAAGIPCQSGSCSEIYLEKAFEQHGLGPKQRLPVAKELGETSLMFLVHPTLTEEDMARTCDVAKDVLRKATR